MRRARHIAPLLVGVAFCVGLAGPGCSRCKDRYGPASTAEASDPASPDDAGVEPATAQTPPGLPSGPERIVLSGVALAVVDPHGRPAVELYQRELAQQIGRQLGESGFFVTDLAQVSADHFARPAALNIEISYDVLARKGPRRGRSLVVVIKSQIAWDDDSDDLAPSENVIVERPLRRRERKNVDGLLAVHAAESLAQVGRGLVAQERVRSGGMDGLRLGLADPNADVVLWTLDLIAERKVIELFDRVAETLGSEQPAIRDRAITTLVALGDTRAVDHLAKRAPFDDHVLLGTVIEAVVALGGDDAREYLEFVASGHPDEGIQRQAAEGIERLDRRARSEAASPER